MLPSWGRDWKQELGQNHVLLVLWLVPTYSTALIATMHDNSFIRVQGTVAYACGDIFTEPYWNMMGYGDLQILGVNTTAWSLETSDYTYRISFKKQGNKDSLSFCSRKLILFAVWRQCQTCQSWTAGNYLVMATFLARFCHTYFPELQMLVKTIIFLTTGQGKYSFWP